MHRPLKPTEGQASSAISVSLSARSRSLVILIEDGMINLGRYSLFSLNFSKDSACSKRLGTSVTLWFNRAICIAIAVPQAPAPKIVKFIFHS